MNDEEWKYSNNQKKTYYRKLVKELKFFPTHNNNPLIKHIDTYNQPSLINQITNSTNAYNSHHSNKIEDKKSNTKP